MSTRRQEAQKRLDNMKFVGLLAILEARVEVDPGRPVKVGHPVHCLLHLKVPDTVDGTPFDAYEPFLMYDDDASTLASFIRSVNTRLLHEYAESASMGGVASVHPHTSKPEWKKFYSKIMGSEE